MKTFKAICAALILAISLSIPTYADGGEVHTPGKSSVVTGGTVDTNDEETGTETKDDIDYSVFADIVWALTSIF
jgi:hypothetical protein